ncbi:ROK family transcriptional regulator [Streptomyces dubilierae]|uniref:ROK family transcriptional regulator n=1 Tax=Streptomyces dubilierae TaxID=3075533 RepID=A0ABU2PJA1_9ACTN|nr:ROK family transcriptional regulator [Streptomyces sp. DSM 41921]MDT0392247.1 ROK family transcriptional regulator [Streptomyces sp. DSM 41921]
MRGTRPGTRSGSGFGSGVNLLALRSHNAALVLDLLRTAGAEGISRLELAERTGLTPQAVSKITARLREDGLAAEAGRRASTGGKPRTVLRLVPEAGHAVGVHLDRDELRVVLVDLRGAVVGERRAPLDLGAGAEAVLGAVTQAVAGVVTGGRPAGASDGALPGRALPGRGDGTAPGAPDAASPGAAWSGSGPALLGAGVALPGPLDHGRGVLHRVTGFPEWDGFPLREALAGRLGVPVVVDKDTNAAALGLAVDGEGGSFAYLHLGTGLGAGLVLGGSVHRGARTGAGEFGHQVIQLDGPPCTCGNRGCVEALSLGAVARGDIEEAARILGAGAANLVGLLDIDVVLLGGRTVAAAPEPFLRGVGAVLTERARRTGQDAVPVRLAPGGGRAVAVGAAQLVLGPVFGRGDG